MPARAGCRSLESDRTAPECSASTQRLPSEWAVDRLLEDELVHRDDRRVKTSLRLSGLPPGQTLGSFDFGFQPSVERSRIETLAPVSGFARRSHF
jgi:DNA replication protein DnaC